MSDNIPLFPVPARIMVLAWLIPFFFAPGYYLAVDYAYKIFGMEDADYWWDIIYYLYFYAILLLVFFGCLAFSRVNWKRWFAAPPSNSLGPAVEITFAVLVFSWAATYWLFYPLLLIAPDFVQYWLLDLPSLIKWNVVSESYPIIANILSFAVVVVLAPVFEEILFRGFLLQRWASKYGTFKAVMLSSAIFAMAHTDPPGAFVFAVAMSYLYIRTGSLWVPIICHSLNNLIVWFWHLGITLYYGPEAPYTMSDFYGEWPYAILLTAITVIWAYRMLPKISPFKSWRAPRI